MIHSIPQLSHLPYDFLLFQWKLGFQKKKTFIMIKINFVFTVQIVYIL